MVASPYDGLYWETHLPLGLYMSLRKQMDRSFKDPNTPNSQSPSHERQWLSLPRSANSYSIKHSVYTFADSADFFTSQGIRTILSNANRTPDWGKELDYSQSGYAAQVAKGLDPDIFNWFPVAYNTAAFPLNIGVQAAVDKTVKMIQGSSAKVFLIGHGKGAVVASKVYEEFRSGRLANRRADLLGVFNFGSPMREAGHTFPGGIDPGGHGIAPERLVDTEDLVWEFVSPDDPMACVGDDLSGQVASLYYSKFDTLVSSPATLYQQMLEIISSSLYGELPVLLPFRLAVTEGQALQLNKLLATLIKEFFSDGGAHDQYQNYRPLTGSNMNAIEVAIAGIQSINLAHPPNSIGSSATEVLTINYRQPVSISEISFEALKKSCFIQIWYLDRANNWRQVLNDNSSPIEIKIGHSQNSDWYKHSSHTYPIVAKAIQFRLTRVADSIIGDTTYCVGLRNVLVRRNVYNRSAGLQGLEDESDALGNIISKVVKDWDADKAIDDSAATFWRSFPQPDPNAVVSFYLDTRDAAGNAQLIDKVYLDPVHSGQSLNLYYSNDETVTSRKLNPSSLIPIAEYQLGSTTASTGTGSTATITLDTSPNVAIGESITISGMSPTAYNGTYTVSDVSYDAPYTISFVSTATGSQTASGVVTTKGQENFEWVPGKGLKDVVPEDSSNSIYRCPFSIGPLVSQDCWIGIQWKPNFNAYSQKSMIIPISTRSVSKVGNVATLELSAAPNVTAGETITVTGMVPEGYNGTYAVTAASNTAPFSVSYVNETTGPQTQSGSVITNNFSPGIKNIVVVEASGTGSIATLTLESDPNVVVGDLITVSGVTPSGYNGTYEVTDVSGNDVSYSCTATGSQTVPGTVSTNAKVKIVGITSPSLANIYSIFDNTSKELIYSKSRDENSVDYDSGTKVLRIPAEIVSSNCLSSDSITIYYGINGPAPVKLSLFEVMPETTTGTQAWPRVFYDSSTAEIGLEVVQPNGGTPLVHSTPLSNLFEADTPINIVVGWKYLDGASPTVYIAAQTSRQTPIASLEISSIDFPSQITLDGKVGFSQWRGTFGAHIVKLDTYGTTSGTQSFLANPPVYCNPDPVLVSPGGTTAPASSLDQAVIAVDWTSQQFAAGGSHSSTYSDKEWTPIWVNYFAEKGFLHLPETTSMKYLKLEFSQLTPEPYPVYDEGIKVMYQVYPITITLVSQQAKGLLGALTNIFGGIGSVNWLNPSTVYQATNAIFGRTITPVQTTLQVGAGYTTDTLPNTTQTAVTESTRAEANSPWVYRRTPVNPFMLVKNYFSQLFGQPQDQGIKSWVPAETQKSIEAQTTITKPTNASPALVPLQGQDWYVFPGQTLRMPSNVIDGLTKSQVVTRRDQSKAVRTRFTTTAVHQYETKTVTLDANIAYFAGIREVQPYVVTYIDYEDPPEFRFDNYDLVTGWSAVNIEKVGTSSITAKANPYSVRNSRFNASLNYWTGEGWDWDTSEGHTLAETWQPGTPLVYGSAHAKANGTNLSLISDPINVESNASINFNAWAVYRDITYTTNAKMWIDAIGLDANDNVIASSINLGEYMEIKSGTNPNNIPGYYIFSDDQPCSSVPQVGVKAIPLYGSVDLATVSSSIRKIQLRLNVNSAITGGDVWFDDVDMMPSAGIVGSVSRVIRTNSKFSMVKCKFNGSPARRSNPMWAYLDSNSNDPRRTILAHYVSTVPSTIMNGNWLDSVTTDWVTAGPWSDDDIAWGTPYAVVSITYSEAIFDKKRVIHFYRQGSTLEEEVGQAGIVVRQELNYVPGGLFRICATFFKETKTNNSMELRLTRISGIESGPGGPEEFPNGVIHREVLTDVPTGYWYTHQGEWIEIPYSQDQIYKVELVLSGNAQDDLYLNDLWTEVSQVRYHVQLGGNNNHDVTALAYKDNCVVGTTEPVNEMAISVEINGSNSFLTEVRDTFTDDEYTTRMASMSAEENSTHLTVLEYTFTDADIGKYVRVFGAGADNNDLKTTIVGVVDGKAILAIPCQTTVTNVTAVFGTDNAVALRNATGFAYSSVFTPLYLQ